MTNVTEARALSPLHRLDAASRAALFTDAKTAYRFASTPITDDQLRSVWDLAKWPPTSANFQTLRVLYVQSPEARELYVQSTEARERLVGHLNENNKEKTLGAPAVAVLAYDRQFQEHLPLVAPHLAANQSFFAENEAPRIDAARNNSWLQAGYFILAARAEGLAVGPMGGFDAAGIDADFFPEGRWATFMVVNLGHPVEDSYRDRLPRLAHDDVIRFA
jgi:3-hydroxypropanoate dehydrogenase